MAKTLSYSWGVILENAEEEGSKRVSRVEPKP